MLEHRLRTVANMAKNAARNPSKIPPWLRSRTKRLVRGAPASVATWRQTALLPEQIDRLNTLRARDRWCLVVLDACRFDAFERVVAPLFDGEVEAVRSLGHDTFQWMQRGWRDQQWNCDYVSGAVPVDPSTPGAEEEWVNHLYGGYQPGAHISRIHPVWDDHWREDLGACLAPPVTDRALDEAGRAARLVVHYQQPHTPFVGAWLRGAAPKHEALGHFDDDSAVPGEGSPVDEPIWRAVEQGHISDRRLRELHRANVRYVAGEVCRLVAELGEHYEHIAVTADHGEALGEYGVYAHPRWPSHPAVRTVPWLSVDGLTDAGAERASEGAPVEPTTGGSRPENGVAERDRGEMLEALGYK